MPEISYRCTWANRSRKLAPTPVAVEKRNQNNNFGDLSPILVDENLVTYRGIFVKDAPRMVFNSRVCSRQLQSHNRRKLLCEYPI